MSFETIAVENRGAVGVVSLNRPASMNAVCAAMLYELADAVNAFESNDSIRVIVVKGQKDFFAAGTDMTEFATLGSAVLEKENLYGRTAETLTACRKPVICAVGGYAFGGGLELVLMADIVIAADNARFGFPEITLGVLPQMGGAALLAGRVGKARAMDILLTGRHVSAQEALEAGIVSRVVDSSELEAETMETARRIAGMPAVGVKLAKKAVSEAVNPDISAQENIAKLSLMSADAREGLNALKENRIPEFRNG